MENKTIRWLLALIAVGLLLNAAVNFKPYVFLVPAQGVPHAQGVRVNVYTGKISPVFLEPQETRKLLQEYYQAEKNLTPGQ
jgi:hypothetical protein